MGLQVEPLGASDLPVESETLHGGLKELIALMSLIGPGVKAIRETNRHSTVRHHVTQKLVGRQDNHRFVRDLRPVRWVRFQLSAPAVRSQFAIASINRHLGQEPKQRHVISR